MVELPNDCPMARILVHAYRCDRCGHVWSGKRPIEVAPDGVNDGRMRAASLGEQAALASPKICPKCKTRLWDTPFAEEARAEAPRKKPWD